MKLRAWFAQRGPAFVHKRARALLARYGITASRAADRVVDCVTMLAEHGCAPTFPTPGRVVQRYPRFFRQLQDAGAEIAVHGYDHVDLRAYPPAEAREQLVKAAQVFAHHGVEAHGFRCPYLSCSDELLEALPNGFLSYSSNEAVWWDTAVANADDTSVILDALRRFYKPKPAFDAVCVPRIRPNLVEIPVSVPDDLELIDGLHLDREEMTQVWCQMLNQTHRRGELFTLMFHPELAWRCRQPLAAVLQAATGFEPATWVARLRDISSWWQEKSNFAVSISDGPESLQISFACSERATILIKGLGPWGPETAWDGAYCQLRARELTVPAEPRPFVGLPADAPTRTVSFLREQGYILDMGETAMRCGTYIDAATLTKLTSEVELIETIEASPGPLVRYWRWPDGAKSALSVTGDLDALTLLDYASRLFVR